jgi:drug/metabolite transporter (DMT)-like permease
VGFVTFAWRHPLFSFHLMLMSTLSFIGHIFIYNMIKDFKQHIVPFVITTRKIISVGISMLYFRHASSLLQVLGILIVFVSTLFEFLTEVIKGDKRDETELVE